MPLQTDIPWLDSELIDIETLYIHVPSAKLRERLLVRTVTANARRQHVHLLTATRGQDRRYSFSPERVLPALAHQLSPTVRETRLQMTTATSQDAVTDRCWETLEDGLTVIDDMTALNNGPLGESALERASQELAGTPYIVLDPRPPYREIADTSECILRLRWTGSGPVKERIKHPTNDRAIEHITITGDQTTLEDFATPASSV